MEIGGGVSLGLANGSLTRGEWGEGLLRGWGWSSFGRALACLACEKLWAWSPASYKLGTMACSCNPTTQGLKNEGSAFKDDPRLRSEFKSSLRDMEPWLKGEMSQRWGPKFRMASKAPSSLRYKKWISICHWDSIFLCCFLTLRFIQSMNHFYSFNYDLLLKCFVLVKGWGNNHE